MNNEDKAITFNDMEGLIGLTYRYQCEGLEVLCTIKNAKNGYGNIRVLITPLNGSGEKWVNLCDRYLDGLNA